jgi:hypothetical protein
MCGWLEEPAILVCLARKWTCHVLTRFQFWLINFSQAYLSLSAHNVLSVSRNAKHCQKRHLVANFFGKITLARVNRQFSNTEKEKRLNNFDRMKNA